MPAGRPEQIIRILTLDQAADMAMEAFLQCVKAIENDPIEQAFREAGFPPIGVTIGRGAIPTLSYGDNP